VLYEDITAGRDMRDFCVHIFSLRKAKQLQYISVYISRSPYPYSFNKIKVLRAQIITCHTDNYTCTQIFAILQHNSTNSTTAINHFVCLFV
jgi:hypothetical protein